MYDVFLSYGRGDRAYAELMAIALAAQGWKVFSDEFIPVRDSFPRRLEQELRSAKSVVVLWSRSSVESRWVREEAEFGAERNVLFPVAIDDVPLPLGFRSIQTIRLEGWSGDRTDAEFRRLAKDLNSVIGQPKPHLSIPAPRPGELIAEEHFALVHSSWRVSNRDQEFGGQRMYQMHVILIGKSLALDQVDTVKYVLDAAYPNPARETTNRERYFELKELANGYSVVRAEIVVRNQPGLVRLSRFVNLTETGPRLETEFMRG